MKYLIFLGIFTSILFSSCRVSNEVCFTFDDLPVANNGNEDSLFYTNTFVSIVNQLKQNRVPAIGFVNEGSLFYNNRLLQYRYDLIKMWSDNGLQLGNHSYSHLSYHAFSLEKYGEDILKGENLTKDFMTANKGTKYYRHPYLHIGETKAKADSLDLFLAKHNYKVAPITIDHEDFLFSNAYQKALASHDTIMAIMIKNDYLNYMEQILLYFEGQSKQLFDRNIRHILLLHNNVLNAHSLNELIAIYRKHQYQFISIDRALKDKAYQSEITVFKNWGISWIDRWALSKRVPNDFFKEEPAKPQYLITYLERD